MGFQLPTSTGFLARISGTHQQHHGLHFHHHPNKTLPTFFPVSRLGEKPTKKAWKMPIASGWLDSVELEEYQAIDICINIYMCMYIYNIYIYGWNFYYIYIYINVPKKHKHGPDPDDVQNLCSNLWLQISSSSNFQKKSDLIHFPLEWPWTSEHCLSPPQKKRAKLKKHKYGYFLIMCSLAWNSENSIPQPSWRVHWTNQYLTGEPRKKKNGLALHYTGCLIGIL